MLFYLRRAWHHSKALPHPFSITLEPLVIESLNSRFRKLYSFANQKGMASFKSAATPFFYNFRTVSHRKLILMNQKALVTWWIASQIRRVRWSSKVLPYPFSKTLEPLIIEKWNFSLRNFGYFNDIFFLTHKGVVLNKIAVTPFFYDLRIKVEDS